MSDEFKGREERIILSFRRWGWEVGELRLGREKSREKRKGSKLVIEILSIGKSGHRNSATSNSMIRRGKIFIFPKPFLEICIQILLKL